MDITCYKILKWKRIDGYYLYLLELPLKHYAVVLHEKDDETLKKSQFEFDWLSALHTYNEWKEEVYEDARKQGKEPVQDDWDLEGL